jgi:hypothetical protein
MDQLKASLTEMAMDRDHRVRMIDEMTRTIEQLRAEIAGERSKVLETEKHWRVILNQQLAGLAADLKSKLRHETQEIELCLNRSTPNTEMALQRIRRIEQILQEVKQGE